MMQPCWRNLLHKACGQHVHGPPYALQQDESDAASVGAAERRRPWPIGGVGAPLGGNGYIENVGGAALRPGEWALEGTVVLYAPRSAAESTANLSAVMPVLESLVEIRGASGVSFVNITFEHATWLRPGQGDGYVEQQSGIGAVGTNPENSDCNNDFFWSVKTPGNVRLHSSSSIRFVGCEFRYLGGVGLDLTNSSGCLVDGCLFHEISSAAINVGSYQYPTAATSSANNSVIDTIIMRAANEYSGAAGLQAGYTQGLVLAHNDISNLTYTGISVGWGWSRHACASCTDAGWNEIAYNRVHGYKQTLNDGGGIYMLGPQNGSRIHHNWLHNQFTASSGALYPDEGSSYSVWDHNAISDIRGSKWLHLWTGSASVAWLQTLRVMLPAPTYAGTLVLHACPRPLRHVTPHHAP